MLSTGFILWSVGGSLVMKSINSLLKGWVGSGSDLSLLYSLCLSAAVP
jgi:hypothetical protein